ncbi:unnamed protein product [Macrosiphum euphorbiae]|uniref:Secreted protein n=1 Tax=Macrosiphum euphorbiae TaxID=13131 RepID=A0AAV0XKE8_9HEMI|nr:unnamed protein product [Macrosiphum euphorbiae]
MTCSVRMPGLGLCPALSLLLWTPCDRSDISGERSVIGVSPAVSSPLQPVRRSASCREVAVTAAFSQPSWQLSFLLLPTRTGVPSSFNNARHLGLSKRPSCLCFLFRVVPLVAHTNRVL